jgi:DNA-binding protein HU-beta
MAKCVNKNNFAKELAERLNCTDVSAKAFIREYHDLIAEKIQEGCAVKMQYFGIFSPYCRTERLGRNPQTGEQCKIVMQNTVKFKPSECILKKINHYCPVKVGK